MKRKRINITLPENLDSYVRRLAEENALSFSTMLQVIILNYKQQNDAMTSINSVNDLRKYLGE